MLIGITFISLAVAVVMTVVAWRATTQERRRAEARIAALAREIHGDTTPAIDRSAEAFALQMPLRSSEREGVSRAEGEPTRDLFVAPSGRTGSRTAVPLAAAGFVVASIAAAAIVFGGGPDTAARARVDAPRAVAATAGAVPPLELIALTHERTGDALTVRGVVRNPDAGSPMERLTAVVSLFDPDGALLTTARAAVEAPALIPGGESTFTVTLPQAAGVGRYRVSFRSGERVVPHVDKRTRT